MQMEINDPTAKALAALATEQAARQAERSTSGADMRWYIWQRLRGTDLHAIEVFKRWKIETYYPRIVQLRNVPRRRMSQAQRKSGMTVQEPHEAALFPGYLFTRIDMSRPDWHDAGEMAGVGGLICRDNRPVYMPNEIIGAIRRRESNGLIQASDTARMIFNYGDSVVVTSGPFADFEAVVENGFDVPICDLVPELRIKVAVNIFGRLTPVELEHWQVARQS